MSDKKAAILDKVRKLLAKAASTPFDEEADLLRSKADELMTAYAIEAFEVSSNSETRVKPEKRLMNISFYWTAGAISNSIWSLFWRCAEHTRCAIIYEYARANDKTCPVVGMPADLDYMDLLFTDLMLQLVGTLDPKPDPKQGYHENLRVLREAGNSWPDAARKMLDAGFDPRPETGSFKVKQDQMTRDYRNWCRKTGVDQNYNHFKTYGRNFADGFVSKIGERFRAMRQFTQGEAEPTGSTALALRDIRLVVAQATDEMFPGLFDARKKRKGRAVADNRKVDYGAMHQGVKAGEKARIATGASSLGNQKEIGK
jgi:hypothetical protein